MSETKFTKGEWKAIEGISETDGMRCGVTVTRGKTDYLLATIENGAPGDLCETEEANAHLIAAAPDLYGLVCGYRSYIAKMPSGDLNEMILEKIDAALAKARGETP